MAEDMAQSFFFFNFLNFFFFGVVQVQFVPIFPPLLTPSLPTHNLSHQLQFKAWNAAF